MYALYIGCTEAETNSMMIEDFLNCTSENCYRVSLYMNNIFNEEGGNVAIE